LKFIFEKEKGKQYGNCTVHGLERERYSIYFSNPAKQRKRGKKRGRRKKRNDGQNLPIPMPKSKSKKCCSKKHSLWLSRRTGIIIITLNISTPLLIYHQL